MADSTGISPTFLAPHTLPYAMNLRMSCSLARTAFLFSFSPPSPAATQVSFPQAAFLDLNLARVPCHLQP